MDGAVDAHSGSEGASPAGGLELDRSSFVPLYYQLQEIIKQLIESGEWQPGAPLPGELALAERFGVSRVVVRQALGILADNRQIVRARGVGTFVAERKLESKAGGLLSIISDLSDPHMTVHVLSRRVEEVSESVRLKLGNNEKRLLSVRFHVALDDTIVAVGHSFFSMAGTEWIMANAPEGASLSAGVTPPMPLARSEISVEASLCDPFEAGQFGVRSGEPVFVAHCLERRARGTATEPVEFSRLVYRSDMIKIRFEREPIGEDRHALAPLWSLSSETSQTHPVLKEPAAAEQDRGTAEADSR
jgi:GntR family transcriptional regulator